MADRPLIQSSILHGWRGERIRIRPTTRDGRPMVRIDVLVPVAEGETNLCVSDVPAVFIPVARVEEVCAALMTAKGCAPEPEPAKEVEEW